MSSTFWDGNGGSSFFNQNLGAWNVASVSDMNMMFSKATKFNQDLSRWNVLRVTNLANMFQSANALSTCNKGAMYNLWGATLRAANPAWSGVTPQVTSALPVNTAPSQASIVTLAGLNFASTDQTPSSYLAAARQSYTPAPLRPTQLCARIHAHARARAHTHTHKPTLSRCVRALGRMPCRLCGIDRSGVPRRTTSWTSATSLILYADVSTSSATAVQRSLMWVQVAACTAASTLTFDGTAPPHSILRFAWLVQLEGRAAAY
jgi:hypothetical protein